MEETAKLLKRKALEYHHMADSLQHSVKPNGWIPERLITENRNSAIVILATIDLLRIARGESLALKVKE